MQETQETQVWSLDLEDPLENEMATQFSIVAWEIRWTEEPGKLQSLGSQRVGHDLATKQQQTSFRKVLYIYPGKFCLSLVIFIIKYLFNVILNNISLILFVNCCWNVKCIINIYLILFPATLLNSLAISTNFLECVLECLYARSYHLQVTSVLFLSF